MQTCKDIMAVCSKNVEKQKTATFRTDYSLGSVFMSQLKHPELVTRTGVAGSTRFWCKMLQENGRGGVFGFLLIY